MSACKRNALVDDIAYSEPIAQVHSAFLIWLFLPAIDGHRYFLSSLLKAYLMNTYFKPSLAIVSVALGALFITGCATKVERTAADTTVDLSGDWNDTDSRMVAQEMIEDMVNQGWYPRFSQDRKRGGVPVVTVGTVENLTAEHIETQTFIADIQRAAINSGRLRFVAGQSQVKELRQNRAQQELNASEKTRKESGKEIGADVALQGKIASINDISGREAVKFYQIDLTLTDIETSEILWQGQKKIKKLVTQPRFR